MAELPDFDPYSVLSVDKTADATVIKKAYRKLALLKHPDKCGGDEELKKLRTDEFQRLNEAYDILGDDEKRQRHDALVKLDALRKEKASLGKGAPRPFMRASTFSAAYPGPTATAYTSRGPTNVEDRAPRFFDDDDVYARRGHADGYYERRSAEKPTRGERTRGSDREAEEKRRMERRREADERRREADIRASRSAKQEFETERLKAWEDQKPRRDQEERARRAHEDPLRKKYSEMEETAQNYTGTKSNEPRPSVNRRNSTRDVPRPVHVAARRSRAPAKGTHEESKAQLEREKEKLAELKEKEREKERAKADRAARAQQAERERVEVERREKERLERYEKEREKEKELRRREREEQQERLERQARSERLEREKPTKRASEYPSVRTKEYVEPYERRPPVLQHYNSSPPFPGPDSVEPSLPRVRTEPMPTYPPPPPVLGRASTMPTVPSNVSTRRSAQPSKLRESTPLQDSGYSSSGTAASAQDAHQNPSPSAKPPKVTKYSYATEADDVYVDPSHRYRTTTREPSSLRRGRSPSPSRLASKMAGLASSGTARGRPTTSHGIEAVRPEMHHSYGSRGSPRAHSPDRPRRDRERDYIGSREPQLYGARTPAHPATSPIGNVSYSRYDEPQYTRASNSRRNDPDPYSYRPTTSYGRAVPAQS